MSLHRHYKSLLVDGNSGLGARGSGFVWSMQLIHHKGFIFLKHPLQDYAWGWFVAIESHYKSYRVSTSTNKHSPTIYYIFTFLKMTLRRDHKSAYVARASRCSCKLVHQRQRNASENKYHVGWGPIPLHWINVRPLMSFQSSKRSTNNYNTSLNIEITFSSPIEWIHVHVPQNFDHELVTWLMLCLLRMTHGLRDKQNPL
jgi:hypothetical protein